MSVHLLASTIVTRFTKLRQLVEPSDIQQPLDAVLEHTRTLTTLALLWVHHHDVSCEGDGKHSLQLMPLLLHLFRATQHKNYAIEAAITQLQYHYLMSDRMRTRLLYSRFVNMHQARGQNIPCDRHMEHLNRYTMTITCAAHIHYSIQYMHLTCTIFVRRNLKVLIGGSGANIREDLVRKYSRLQQSLPHLCAEFDKDAAMSTTSIQQQRHSTPKLKKDICIGVNSLQRGDVFEDKGRVWVQQGVELFRYIDDSTRQKFNAWFHKRFNYPVK